MNKKGFTLIELLAVLIILAIISLIAVPIVSNAIETSKVASYIKSGERVIAAADTYYFEEGIIDKTVPIDVTSLNIKGNKPEIGSVYYDNDSNSNLYMYMKGYCVVKLGNNSITAVKSTKEECNFTKTENIVIADSSEVTNGSTNGVSLNSSASDLREYQIYGNSYQETRSGKNLFNIDSDLIAPTGISYTTSGNEIKITSDGQYNRLYISLQAKANTSYTISGIAIRDLDTGNSVIQIWKDSLQIGSMVQYFNIQKNKNEQTFSLTYKPTDDCLLYFVLYSNYGTPSPYIKATYKNVQIEEGEVATPYESYGVMPSPEFASEIKSLGRYNSSTNKYDIDVKSTKKNLFKTEDFINVFNNCYTTNKPSIKTIDGEEVLDVWGGCNAVSSGEKLLQNQFKANTQYTMSFDLYDIPSTYNGLYGVVIKLNYSDGTYNDITPAPRIFNQWYHVSYTSTSNKTISYITISYGTGLGESYLKNIQLEEGTTETTYEPYQSKVTTISLDEPLRCIESVCDYVDYSEKQVVRKIGKIVFDGSEDWRVSTYYDKNNFILNFPLSKAQGQKSSNSMSNRLSLIKGTSYADEFPKQISGSYIFASYSATTSGIYVYFPEISSVDSWKDYLEEENGKGNPIIVYYELLDPAKIQENLPNINIFQGYNNITISDGTMHPSKFTVTGVK